MFLLLIGEERRGFRVRFCCCCKSDWPESSVVRMESRSLARPPTTWLTPTGRERGTRLGSCVLSTKETYWTILFSPASPSERGWRRRLWVVPTQESEGQDPLFPHYFSLARSPLHMDFKWPVPSSSFFTHNRTLFFFFFFFASFMLQVTTTTTTKTPSRMLRQLFFSLFTSLR